MDRTFAAALFALMVSILPGCVPLYYAYPTLSCTFPASVGPNHDHIYAFRVDIADERGCIDFKYTGSGHYTFRQLNIPPEGNLPAQARVALDRGFYWNCIAACFEEHTRNTVRVRLYRPGYGLVEIQSWKRGQPIEWKDALDLDDQEKAVDALVGVTGEGDGSHDGIFAFAHLEPGSASREHRRVLLFAAAEYERLGRSLTLEAGKREPLEAKAKALRERADH